MNTYFLNPTLQGNDKYIREGRCMQKASSWATAWPPITLATLAAIAKKKNSVRLLDGNVESIAFSDLIEDLKAHQPDLIVINTGFPSIDHDMDVAQKIKEVFPDTKLLGFGVYFTLLEKEALEHYPFLDFGIIGEPEETFEELLDRLAEGSTDYHPIKGLAWRNASGVYMNPARPFIQDMDQLPFPDRSLLKNDRYRLPHNNKIYTLINIARGCPYPCTYCIVNPYYGQAVRKHSVDYVIREIKECLDQHGVQEFLFWEEVFTLDRSYALAICEAILEHRLPIRWAATTRVGLLDEALLQVMKKAGCYLLGLGIESGNQTILDNAKKKQTVAEIKHAVALCQKAGIKTMGHFIFGLPGETKETANQTIKFMKDLKLDYVQSYCAVPYPKTAFGQLAKEQEWIRADRWSQYDFGGASVVDMGTLSPEEVTSFREKAFQSFYFRPSYLLKKLLREWSLFQGLRMLGFKNWINSNRKGQTDGNRTQCCDSVLERGADDRRVRPESADCVCQDRPSR